MIDAEIRLGETERVRDLFERVTGRGKLKSRKAKFFFKKWLAFEKKIGDAKTMAKVEGKAAEYSRLQTEKGSEQ